MHPLARAFTLIELLVVVTIIVVLLAMLTPTLDKAIYQAELAVCGTHLKGISTGALVYAADHKRQYPYRPTARGNTNGWVQMIYNPGVPGTALSPASSAVRDDRPVLRNYLQIKLLLDPLSGTVDLENTQPASTVLACYGLWVGFQYVDSPENGMFKMGDRFTYKNDSYNVLAADRDSFAEVDGNINGSHPDRDGALMNQILQDQDGFTPVVQPLVSAQWFNNVYFGRGPIDMQFVFDDGSVERMTDVPMPPTVNSPEEQNYRLRPVPAFANARNYPTNNRMFIPKAK